MLFSTIGDLVSEDILDLDDDDFTTHSQTKYKDHPCVKKLLEKHPEPCKLSFKTVNPECVQSIISHLDLHKATGHDRIPSKILKIAALAIATQSHPLSTPPLIPPNSHHNVRRLRWALCTRRMSSLIRKTTNLLAY